MIIIYKNKTATTNVGRKRTAIELNDSTQRVK